MTETIRHEVEVDTEIARLSEVLFRAEATYAAACDSIHYAAKDKKVSDYSLGRRRTVWGRRLDECLEAVKLIAVTEPVTYITTGARKAIARLEDAAAAVKVAGAALTKEEEKYQGWTRFFLVQNTDGHIHSSQHCSTCTYTTRFSWLPTLSGLTEADAVAAHGPRLCSVCYPSAPVEWTLGIPKDAGCAGSGKPAAGSGRRYSACPDCGKYVAITQYGFIRKHAVAKEKVK